MLQKKFPMNAAYSGCNPETERIESLKKYNIREALPDYHFNHITHMAVRLLQVPVAVVTFVDTDSIWFVSGVGLALQQTERHSGLCSSAILQDEVYVVENAQTDPRTLSNPLVTGEFGLRFYAAAPLKVRDGNNLGTLCVIGKIPRQIGEDEKEILKGLARIVVDQLELRYEANRAGVRQNEILSMIAHELKNPLTIIPAYADLIREEAKDKEHIGQMCNHIRKASDRMTLLIKDVLETARLQVNEISFNKTQFDISTIIGRVASLNLVLANAKNQKLYLSIHDNLTVYADETKMTEIADNLINNAIKYSPPGAEIHLKLTSGFNKAIFEVIDEGPGLTEADKLDLFKPYTRLSARPTGGENSTGVGLSIVKMLVDAHGGSIYVENNTEKKGARFVVEIPVADGAISPVGSDQVN